MNSSFILTMRNVNINIDVVKKSIFRSFILTMRNVNFDQEKVFQFLLQRFILTMRNVNVIVNLEAALNKSRFIFEN